MHEMVESLVVVADDDLVEQRDGDAASEYVQAVTVTSHSSAPTLN